MKHLLLRIATPLVVLALSMQAAADGTVGTDPWNIEEDPSWAHTNQDGPVGHTNQDWVPPDPLRFPPSNNDRDDEGSFQGAAAFDNPIDDVDVQLALEPGSHALPSRGLKFDRGPGLDMDPSMTGSATMIEDPSELDGALESLPFGGGSVSPVPAPGALSLLGLSILTLAGRRRRRRR